MAKEEEVDAMKKVMEQKWHREQELLAAMDQLMDQITASRPDQVPDCTVKEMVQISALKTHCDALQRALRENDDSKAQNTDDEETRYREWKRKMLNLEKEMDSQQNQIQKLESEHDLIQQPEPRTMPQEIHDGETGDHDMRRQLMAMEKEMKSQQTQIEKLETSSQQYTIQLS